jgi:hypothetical protein
VELPDAGGGVVAVALAPGDALAVAEDEHWLALGLASFLLPVALVLAVGEVAGLAVPVAEALALTDAVLVAALSLSLGLAAPPAALLAPAAGELGVDPPGAASGLAGLSGLDGVAFALEEELGGHAVGVLPIGLAEVPPGPPAPLARPLWVPEPAAVPAPPLSVDEDEAIPTAEPSWPMASRSGGTARTTPMANTTQATARAGRSSPYRHGGRPRPGSPGPSTPPRIAFQRRTRSARKPSAAPAAPAAFACLLAWAGPDRTRARIRSSPSGPGST